MNLKFSLSEKAKKIDKIFTVNLTVCGNHQMVKISSIFVAFLENINFMKSSFLPKYELKIVTISFMIWEKGWFPLFILILTDL